MLSGPTSGGVVRYDQGSGMARDGEEWSGISGICICNYDIIINIRNISISFANHVIIILFHFVKQLIDHQQ